MQNLAPLLAPEMTLFSITLVSRRETAGEMGSYSNMSPPTVNCVQCFCVLRGRIFQMKLACVTFAPRGIFDLGIKKMVLVPCICSVEYLNFPTP